MRRDPKKRVLQGPGGSKRLRTARESRVGALLCPNESPLARVHAPDICRPHSTRCYIQKRRDQYSQLGGPICTANQPRCVLGKPSVPQDLQDQGELAHYRAPATEPRRLRIHGGRWRPGSRQAESRESVGLSTQNQGARRQKPGQVPSRGSVARRAVRQDDDDSQGEGQQEGTSQGSDGPGLRGPVQVRQV